MPKTCFFGKVLKTIFNRVDFAPTGLGLFIAYVIGRCPMLMPMPPWGGIILNLPVNISAANSEDTNLCHPEGIPMG
jgi:hypothetical protein